MDVELQENSGSREPMTRTELLHAYEDALQIHGGDPAGPVLAQLSDPKRSDEPPRALSARASHLGGTTRGFTALLDLLSRARLSIRQVDLSECDLGNRGLERFLECASEMTRLERLDLSYNGLEAASAVPLARAIASGSPPLSVVDVSGNFLGGGLDPLVPALRTASSKGRVRMLKLGDNELDAKGVRALAAILRSPSPLAEDGEPGSGGGVAAPGPAGDDCTLINLHLSDNAIDARLAQGLASALAANATLTNLDLRYNALSDHGAAALAGAVRGHRSLLGLVLWGNKIGPLGARSLAHMLSHNAVLQSLDLGLNPVKPEGAIAIKDALGRNRSLTTLGLASCDLTDEGIVAVAESLEANDTLLNIDLRRNGATVAGVMALRVALRHNTTLCTLALASSADAPVEDELDLELRAEIDAHCEKNKTARAGQSGSTTAKIDGNSQEQQTTAAAAPDRSADGNRDAGSPRGDHGDVDDDVDDDGDDRTNTDAKEKDEGREEESQGVEMPVKDDAVDPDISSARITEENPTDTEEEDVEKGDGSS